MAKKMVVGDIIMMRTLFMREIGIEIEKKEKEDSNHSKDNMMDCGSMIKNKEKGFYN